MLIRMVEERESQKGGRGQWTENFRERGDKGLFITLVPKVFKFFKV